MEQLTVVQINTFPYKATGSIMMNLHNAMIKNGVNSFVIWGRGRKPENSREFSIEDSLGIKMHGLYSRLFDKTGFASHKATKRLLKILDELGPDIIHLHNIHGYFLNIELLFKYIKEKHIKVVWTLHDCWPFTGHCAYFDAVGCTKWIEGCKDCEQLKTYPTSILCDASEMNWRQKRALFTGADVTVITPSVWLSGLVKKSYLREYPVKVIHNGIDLSTFSPRRSQFSEIHGIKNKIVVLGVASEWTDRKGLQDFYELARMIDKDNIAIVLVGLTDKQIKKVPNSIIALNRTNNIQELVEIYSAADVFFNPTYEDNYPTTNLEALACGTPVVTYFTGGSPESINRHCGVVLPKGDVIGFNDILSEFKGKKLGYEIEQQKIKKFDIQEMTNQYLELYQKLV